MQDLVFDYPEAAFFLLVLIVFFFLFYSNHLHRKKALKAFADRCLLSRLLVSRPCSLRLGKEVLFCLSWVAASMALMQPKGNARFLEENIVDSEGEMMFGDALREDEFRRKFHEIVFLVDVSASMGVRDARLGKTRLEYAKEIIDEAISLLDGQNVSIYSFTSEASKQVPSTVDYLYTRLILRDLEINEGGGTGTDLMEALDRIRKDFSDGSLEKAKTLALLTDGGDIRLESLRGSARDNETNIILSRVSDFEMQNWQVYCIGMGTREGGEITGISFEGKPVTSSLDEELLLALSREGKGRYCFANDFTSSSLAGDIVGFLQGRVSHEKASVLELSLGEIQIPVSEKNEAKATYDLYYQIPLAFAVLFLLFALLLPETWARSTFPKGQAR